MQGLYQTNTTRFGAFAACLASILEIPLEHLPPIPDCPSEADGVDTSWYTAYESFLQDRYGLALLSFPIVTKVDPTEAPKSIEDRWFPPGYSILLCEPKTVRHALVCLEGTPAWNPWPGTGKEIGDTGTWEYWVVFQILDPSHKKQRF